MARMNERTVLVDGALPGEQVEAIYVRRRRNQHELQARSILRSADQRVNPGCDYADSCGGCSLRHMHVAAQMAFKESVLLKQLQHSIGLQPPDFDLLPPIGGETVHYRRKARLAVRHVPKKGGVLVGFREKYSTFVTVMSDCQVLSREVAVLIAPLQELITDMDLAAEIPQIEVAVGESGPAADEKPMASAEHTAEEQSVNASGLPVSNNNANVVALVFRHLKPLTAADRDRLLSFAQTRQIQLYLQPGGPDSVHKLVPDGEERLSYYLPDSGLQLKFHPLDFTQVNAGINRQLVQRAIELLAPDATDRVLDLFCGLGNFTLPLSLRSASVLGIDGSETMVARARENATLNGISNTHFMQADLYKPETGEWSQALYDKVLLDPPRSGALEIMPLLVRCQPSRLLYISCNPTTMARDMAVLLASGYRLQSAGVMDMFPHTSHIESMALLVADRPDTASRVNTMESGTNR